MTRVEVNHLLYKGHILYVYHSHPSSKDYKCFAYLVEETSDNKSPTVLISQSVYRVDLNEQSSFECKPRRYSKTGFQYGHPARHLHTRSAYEPEFFSLFN